MYTVTQINNLYKMYEFPDLLLQSDKSLYNHCLNEDPDSNLLPKDMEVEELDLLTSLTTATNIPDDQPATFASRPIEAEKQIRNHDCMWSGRCTDHPEKLSYRQAVARNQRNIQRTQSVPTTTTTTDSKKASIVATIGCTAEQQIAPGRSLLRLNQPKQHVQMTVPSMTTNDFLRDRDSVVRPDTPLSLDDDDAPLFKHTIDLAACTMGSNKMSLISPSMILPQPQYYQSAVQLPQQNQAIDYINRLKEHLEDPTNNKKLVNLPNVTSDEASLNDLMEDLVNLSDYDESCSSKDNLPRSTMTGRGNSRDEGGGGIPGPKIKSKGKQIVVPPLLSQDDYDDDDDDDLEEEEEEVDEAMIEDDDEDDEDYTTINRTIPARSKNSSSGSSSTNDSCSEQKQSQQVMHSDHSYTRCKQRVDVIGLGVETPSDSEEEIDVVSVGDKTLPTNPTAKDRRALQTTVAHKISARIVKTTNGLRTIPPQRRHRTDPTQTSTSSAYGSGESTPIKVTNKLYPSTSQYYQQYQPNVTVSGNSRKRTSGSSNQSNSTKRSRSKKQSHSHASTKRIASDSDETDTIEKRNLHNDMERQRRIGLKNLFEELKRQIPTLRDKERAPKVNILREAAFLCRKYNREEMEREELKRIQSTLYQRVSVLRTSLADLRDGPAV